MFMDVSMGLSKDFMIFDLKIFWIFIFGNISENSSARFARQFSFSGFIVFSFPSNVWPGGFIDGGYY